MIYRWKAMVFIMLTGTQACWTSHFATVSVRSKNNNSVAKPSHDRVEGIHVKGQDCGVLLLSLIPVKRAQVEDAVRHALRDVPVVELSDVEVKSFIVPLLFIAVECVRVQGIAWRPQVVREPTDEASKACREALERATGFAVKERFVEKCADAARQSFSLLDCVRKSCNLEQITACYTMDIP